MNAKETTGTLNVSEATEKETIRKVTWRLIPLLMLGYFCAYLDRSNVGMAATMMLKDLNFTQAVFGFGAGLFFLGYFAFEIPSNLILNKVGARKWIARIMITWGAVAALTCLVNSEWTFYINRVLLGLAEAGFYPGVILYLTWWFPARYRGRMMSIFQSSLIISLFVGPMVGGLLLKMEGFLGMHGWQWLYLIEGLPPVIMGGVIYKLLTDKPSDAQWLSGEQRTWLIKRIESENSQREAVRKYSLKEALTNRKVLLLTLAYVGQNISNYGLIFFLPLIVKNLGVSTEWIGTVSAIPYLFAFIATIAWGYHSDLTGERTWHVAGAALVAAAGLASCVLLGPHAPVLTMVLLCVAMMGQQALSPIFWSIPTAILTGVAAAGGIAMINAVGNLGGWIGPSLYGLVTDMTGSSNTGLLILSIGPLMCAVCVVAASRGLPHQQQVCKKLH
ncbi:MFS transporter [Klebsiella quasipneumoniae]|uniref:MFS transporter n=1 Tax=Klebsiella quasipneumoniae TaxID=1463165 RepID=UPI000CEC2A36|nr:MFS transporter [Klebsiella quasipneumoniae]ROC60473.1 MFS transporter [Klebsiella quasipneumoniae subsp. quasipneumoniae]